MRAYRVWCKNKKEWEKDLVTLLPNGTLIDLVRRIPLNRETHIVQFFTGVYDKHNKPIYEGDICKYEWEGIEIIDVVVFEPPMFTYKRSIRWTLYIDEVIGNIYENSDLIK